MKFKLDENFGTRTQRLFQEAGFDVHTVVQESLQGASDQVVYETCCNEDRCLVTLDLDFSDIVRFPPDQLAGIIVIRAPHNPSLPLLEQMVATVIRYCQDSPIAGQLLIVEVGRIRIHQPESGST
ncbi:MAG: DUF5615 family PIN-like protein [Caldilineaceae bacterium]|nr:DUF5615 family PIN-like protein [Caldilineaceae bacterium]